MEWAVGRRYREYALCVDFVVMTITQEGPVIRYVIKNPSSKEIASLHASTPFKIGYRYEMDVIFFVAKFGDLEWIDMPFALQIEPNPINIDRLGNILHIMCFNAATGELLNNRIIGLGNEFMYALKNDLHKQMQNPMDKRGYDMRVSRTYAKYSTNQLVKRLNAYYEVDGGTQTAAGQYEVDDTCRYPGLPDELKPFYEYVPDSGHSLWCVLEVHREKGAANPKNYQVPVPVKYVLSHPHKIECGVLFVDAPYDSFLGLRVDEKYSEF